MQESRFRSGFWQRRLSTLALAIFLAVAAFFLFTEHRAHLYGALPYLLLLVCVALLVILWRALRLPPTNDGLTANRPSKPGKGGTSDEP